MSAAPSEPRPASAPVPPAGPLTAANAAVQMRRMTRRSFAVGAALTFEFNVELPPKDAKPKIGMVAPELDGAPPDVESLKALSPFRN